MGSGDNINVKFTFNIFSETMNDYLFADDSSQPNNIVDVPDGRLWFELYQIDSIFHDTPLRDIADYAQIAVTEGLKPKKAFDFQYGDSVEAMAIVAQINRQLHQYCTIDNDGSSAFASCPQDYNAALVGRGLRSRYGLMGNISISTGATRNTVVSFPFCSLTSSNSADGSGDPGLIDPLFCLQDSGNSSSVPGGGLCYDGFQLAKNFQCQSRYPFSVWAYGQPNRNVSIKPTVTKQSRTLTPFNNVIGAVIISQYRRKESACAATNQDTIKVLTGQFVCQSPDRGDSPFGIDPAYQKTSILYNGKLKISDYYADNERQNSDTLLNATRYPFAFFPHQWDSGAYKQQDYISKGNVGVYKLFFDTRLSSAQASKMVQYMRDGMFISDKTDTVEVEIITYNPDFNIFGILTIQFNWDLGGGILWSAQYNTAQLSPYTGVKGQLTLLLEVIFGVMLLVDILRESRDIYLAILKEELIFGYVCKFWNWIDWSHYGLLGTGLGMWTGSISSSFNPPPPPLTRSTEYDQICHSRARLSA
jgi:hypothetical protein